MHALKIEGGHVNLVHRDVSPHNLLLSSSGSLKLIDFGIAKAATNRNLTNPGTTKGKAGYFSPEQAMGKLLDGRSDLFSLAGSLYQLLCGKLPFEGDSMAQLMFKIASEPPTDILSVRPDVPAGLVAFLDKAFAKEADDRFQTGEEFAAALRAAFAGGGAPAAQPAAAPAAPAAGGGVDIEL